MSRNNKVNRANKDVVELIAPWGLALLASLTAFGAIFRVFNATKPDVLKGIDNTTLLYLVVAGALLLLRQIKTLSFGDVKLEMLEKVKEQVQDVEQRQEESEKILRALSTALEGIVTKYERQHLEKLKPQSDDTARFGPDFFEEIERLDAIGFIVPTKGEGLVVIKNEHGQPGEELHLREYVKLTEKGEQYLRIFADIMQK